MPPTNRPTVPRRDSSAKNQVLPGEPGTPGEKPGERPTRPSTAYKDLSRAVKTKGIQPGERDILAKIIAKRGGDAASARVIAARRIGRGQNVAGMVGPKNIKPTVPTGGQLPPGTGPGPKPAPGPDTNPKPGTGKPMPNYRRPNGKPGPRVPTAPRSRTK